MNTTTTVIYAASDSDYVHALTKYIPLNPEEVYWYAISQVGRRFPENLAGALARSQVIILVSSDSMKHYRHFLGQLSNEIWRKGRHLRTLVINKSPNSAAIWHKNLDVVQLHPQEIVNRKRLLQNIERLRRKAPQRPGSTDGQPSNGNGKKLPKNRNTQPQVIAQPRSRMRVVLILLLIFFLLFLITDDVSCKYLEGYL